jgi:hypothetical protein
MYASLRFLEQGNRPSHLRLKEEKYVQYYVLESMLNDSQRLREFRFNLAAAFQHDH